MMCLGQGVLGVFIYSRHVSIGEPVIHEVRYRIVTKFSHFVSTMSRSAPWCGSAAARRSKLVCRDSWWSSCVTGDAE